MSILNENTDVKYKNNKVKVNIYSSIIIDKFSILFILYFSLHLWYYVY